MDARERLVEGMAWQHTDAPLSIVALAPYALPRLPVTCHAWPHCGYFVRSMMMMPMRTWQAGRFSVPFTFRAVTPHSR